MQQLLNVIHLDLAWPHMPIEPSIYGLKSDTKFFGELLLAELVFEPVSFELIYQSFWHGHRI